MYIIYTYIYIYIYTYIYIYIYIYTYIHIYINSILKRRSSNMNSGHTIATALESADLAIELANSIKIGVGLYKQLKYGKVAFCL